MIQNQTINIDALLQSYKCKVFHASDRIQADLMFSRWEAKYKDKINVIGYTYTNDIWEQDDDQDVPMVGMAVIAFYQKINDNKGSKKLKGRIERNKSAKKSIVDINTAFGSRNKVKRGKHNVGIR